MNDHLTAVILKSLILPSIFVPHTDYQNCSPQCSHSPQNPCLQCPTTPLPPEALLFGPHILFFPPPTLKVLHEVFQHPLLKQQNISDQRQQTSHGMSKKRSFIAQGREKREWIQFQLLKDVSLNSRYQENRTAFCQDISQWGRDRSEELSLRQKLLILWDPALARIPCLRLELRSW